MDHLWGRDLSWTEMSRSERKCHDEFRISSIAYKNYSIINTKLGPVCVVTLISITLDLDFNFVQMHSTNLNCGKSDDLDNGKKYGR